MPPRKGLGRGIVKSGNAGNSSKASPTQLPTQLPVNTTDRAYFPPGSKYPLSLLNERCQKNGWEKPEVYTYRLVGYGWVFTVTLRRNKKKSSELETVKLEPHPPIYYDNEFEAKQWGATYALYRICNNMQLHRVLPPGPREYWAQLELEHKAAPEHMKWMYNPDPFLARREVQARQELAAKRREENPLGSSTAQSGTVGGDFTGVIEVKMSGSLRELVESTIKKAHNSPSSVVGKLSSSVTIPLETRDSVASSLTQLSFTSLQITRTLKALSTPSPLTASLLASSPTPLDAAISHLLLCVPECDLPARYLSRETRDSFVHSMHKGTEMLKSRWLLERAVKEAGYPEHIVKSVLMSAVAHVDSSAMDWATLLGYLGQMLVGDSYDAEGLPTEFDLEERDTLRASEISVLQSVYASVEVVNDSSPETSEANSESVTCIVIPIPDSPLSLNIVLPAWHPYPLSDTIPSMYLSATRSTDSMETPSASRASPYIRLHILSTILGSDAAKSREYGEGIGLVAASIAEEEWAKIQSEGPPDVADVLQPLLSINKELLSPSQDMKQSDSIRVLVSSATENTRPQVTRSPVRMGDDRSDEQILIDFEKTKCSERYRALLKERLKLPAWKARSDFLRAFKGNRVVVCVGETGSGKTTQVPQYILDDHLASPRGVDTPSLAQLQIIVTQPRRVAAMSVASRVSAERGDDGSVAYTIRGESSASRRTKLLFCTTGVALRRLVAGDGLHGVSVIVVDEVHERSVESDFLLLELRELLKKNKSLKAVLMSATINQQTFVDYFGEAALVTIPGRIFPVQDLYLEDIIPRISYSPSFTKPAQKQSEQELQSFRKMYEVQGLDAAAVRALEIVTRAERIDYQLIASIVSYIVANKDPGAILIFMPGVQEIRRCIESLKGLSLEGPVKIYPLHANLSSDEQNAVFRSNATKRKIVVATNVAETSITIDDVVYVIDAGKVKETSYDPETGLSRLAETWVTQAAARQRRGRAGRTGPGECYKLYTREQEESLGQFPVPEILRVPLESLSLTVKAMRENEDVKLFLAKAIDPPPVVAMEKAWSVLQELGAVDENDRLTALGRHMALLPVDLRLGKMLVLGSIFRCLDPILTVAACLSSKPLFFSPMDRQEEASQARMKFQTANSDLLTDVRAYEECIKVLAQRRSQALHDFCEENFISYAAVRDITSLREELLSALASAGFVSHRAPAQAAGSSSMPPHPALVKSIIMAGLYPRIARVTLPSSAIRFDKVQAGTVQREQEARAYRMYDLEPEPEPGGGGGRRVFLHPSSVLFGQDRWRDPFLCYFRKAVTTKPFLRDVTEVPLFAVLLFGGPITVDHIKGWLTIGGGPGKAPRIRMKAWPRIGVLANQLRQLLDAELSAALETSLDGLGDRNPVVEAMMALLTKEGFEFSGTA